MAFCIYEQREYADDDPDQEFILATDEDVGHLASLSDPEEWSLIETHCCNSGIRLF